MRLKVVVYSTPVAVRQRVNADLGIFAQDTWHIKRLSVTGGLRFEYQKSSIEPSAIGAGPVIAAGSLPQNDWDTSQEMRVGEQRPPRRGLRVIRSSCTV